MLWPVCRQHFKGKKTPKSLSKDTRCKSSVSLRFCRQNSTPLNLLSNPENNCEPIFHPITSHSPPPEDLNKPKNLPRCSSLVNQQNTFARGVEIKRDCAARYSLSTLVYEKRGRAETRRRQWEQMRVVSKTGESNYMLCLSRRRSSIFR